MLSNSEARRSAGALYTGNDIDTHLEWTSQTVVACRRGLVVYQCGREGGATRTGARNVRGYRAFPHASAVFQSRWRG
jgi:hypothetical protein